MSVLLVSPKNKGNTYDVLSYVVKNSDVKLLVIGKEEMYNLKEYETIIICSGVYGGNLHSRLQRWLRKLDKTSIHENAKFYIFLTWFGRGQSDKATIRKVEKILEKKDIFLETDHITCFGGAANIKHNHPNEEDCQEILNWVRLKN